MENRDREHYSIFGNLDSIDRGAMYNGAAIGTPPRMSEEKAAVEREFDVFKTSRWPSSLEKAIDGLFGMSLVESRYRRERAQTDIRDYEKLIDFRREQPLSLPRRFDSKQDSFDSGIGVSPKGRPLTGMRPTVDLSEYKPKTSEGPKNVDPVRPVRLHEELAQLPHPPIFLKDYPCAYPPYYQPSIGQLYETDHGSFLHSMTPCNGGFGDQRWRPASSLANPMFTLENSVEKQAIEHRRSAQTAEPRCTWSGQLPQRQHKGPTYSPKVFLGGIPWDINEADLVDAFSRFGTLQIIWPNEPRSRASPNSQKPGYVYIVFENDKKVKELLASCTHDYCSGGKWYFNISSRKMKCKDVQVIPWVIADANHVRCPSQRLDPSKTVFVGALHGMLTAEGLAHVMNDLFNGVAYVGIDTDKFKYPIGSARVTFSNQKSYIKAVQAAFVDIKTPRFNKKIQIDPYLENSICSTCNSQQGPIFCRDSTCFRYFCRACWQWTHSTDDLQHHKPLMRTRRD